GDGEAGGENEWPEPVALDGAGEDERQQRQHARRERGQRAGDEAEETSAHAAPPARLERALEQRAELAGVGDERRAATLRAAVEGDQRAAVGHAQLLQRRLVRVVHDEDDQALVLEGAVRCELLDDRLL